MGIEPVIGFCLRGIDCSVGKQRLLLVVDQPAHVIQVQMSEQDGIDLLRAITGGLHVRREHSSRGADALAGTGVHQDQLLAGIDQKSIERGLHPGVSIERRASKARIWLWLKPSSSLGDRSL